MKKEIAALEDTISGQKLSSSDLFKGWSAEHDIGIDENLATVQTSYTISIGSATVTAVAALEGLLIDLIPDGIEAPEGLHQLMEHFLKRHQVAASKKRAIHKKLRKVSDRRNQFAHAVTGSYFSTNESIQDMFTEEALEDTLYIVATLGLEMEGMEFQHSSSA